MRLLIDPGHGGTFTGAAVSHPQDPDQWVYEKDFNLAIARQLKPKICPEIDFKFTRHQDCTTLWETRRKLERSFNPDLVVSIHCNWGQDPTWTGVDVFHWPSNQATRRLAQQIADKVTRGRVFPTDSDWRRARTLLAQYNADTILVECGYMSNAEDLEELMYGERKYQCASVIADVINRYSDEHDFS